MAKKTALYEEHVSLGARLVEFAGWEMPVQYVGLRQEHVATREAVGLFDVSHMGEFRARGPKAVESLQWLTTNDVAALETGQAHYTLFPNSEGGIVDDLIIYCLEKDNDYLLCVNAANVEKDWRFVSENNRGAELSNESDQWSQVAVQGPKAVELTARVLSQAGDELRAMKPFQVIQVAHQGETLIVASTGYTGEAGFEVFLPNSAASGFWQELLQKGEDLGVQPVGLGARDTLRAEMKYSLYGNEIDDRTNPYMAGLGWVVKPLKKDFLGRNSMVAGKEQGFDQKLVSFRAVDKGIPRAGYGLFSFDKEQIGRVTSGTMSPSLNVGVGLGYVKKDFAAEGSEIFVDIRGRRVKAEVVKKLL